MKDIYFQWNVFALLYWFFYLRICVHKLLLIRTVQHFPSGGRVFVLQMFILCLIVLSESEHHFYLNTRISFGLLDHFSFSYTHCFSLSLHRLFSAGG